MMGKRIEVCPMDQEFRVRLLAAINNQVDGVGLIGAAFLYSLRVGDEGKHINEVLSHLLAIEDAERSLDELRKKH